MRIARFLTPALLALLAACSSTGGTRVSEPAASVQQLTVDVRGNWQVQLRLQNYSSVGMTFNAVDLALSINGQPAMPLHATPAIYIPAESADVVDLRVRPDSTSRLHVADALAGNHGLAYTLKGNINATPEKSGARTFSIESRTNQLNPVPGLPGALR